MECLFLEQWNRQELIFDVFGTSAVRLFRQASLFPPQLRCHTPGRRGLSWPENLGSIPRTESILFPGPPVPIPVGFLCLQPVACSLAAHQETVSLQGAAAACAEGRTRELVTGAVTGAAACTGKDKTEQSRFLLASSKAFFLPSFFPPFFFFKEDMS